MEAQLFAGDPRCLIVSVCELQVTEGAPAPCGVCPPPSPCGFCARPLWAPLRRLCLWLGVALCAARLVSLLSALVWLSALPLLVVSLVSLLVRLSAWRCGWLSLPGSGAVRCLFLPGLWCVRLLWAESPLSLWSPLFPPALPCPFPLFLPLLVWLLSFPRPGAPVSLPLAVAPCLPRARGAAPPPAFVGAASRVCFLCRVCWPLWLSRRRRSMGRAFWSFCRWFPAPVTVALLLAGLPANPPLGLTPWRRPVWGLARRMLPPRSRRGWRMGDC